MAMRHAILPAFALQAMLASASVAANCDGDTTGMAALTDLGAGTYQGVIGGLYPGGVNHRPAAHDLAGRLIAQSIVPLDTLGQAAPAGSVVLVSIGMSNATQEFSAFVPKATADPLKRPECRVIDCALGGQSADRIDVPTAAYWDSVATRLRGHGSSPLQVQVAWIKEADAQPSGSFQVSNDSLLAHLRSIVGILKQELPNLKLVYFTSRIYAGYASTPLNPEPYAYESGFAVRRIIEAQIAGDPTLNYDPANGAVLAPWLAWGPYLWSDGLRGRADGLTWACSDFAADGTHPAASARHRVSDSLLVFFRNDQTTAPWYRQATVGVPEPRAPLGLSLAIRPNPSRGAIRLAIAVPGAEPWRLTIVDAQGRRLHSRTAVGGAALVWEGRDSAGAPVARGTYWARLECANGSLTRRFVLR
jgi:hypothetical protein